MASPFRIGPRNELGFLQGGTLEKKIHRRTDRSNTERSRRRHGSPGRMPETQYLRTDLLPLEVQVRWHGGVRGQAPESAGKRERGAQEDRGRAGLGYSNAQGRKPKKVVSLPERRRATTYLKNEYNVSERRACRVMSIHRSSYRHPGPTSLDEVEAEVIRLSQRYAYWGYRKNYDLIDRDRYPVGRERVRLIRRREGLQVARKRRKKRVLGTSTQWVHRATHPNHVWSWDFVHDQTHDARKLRFLSVIDEFTKESLSLECSRSLTSSDVLRVLGRLVRERGAPGCIRSDNGPEFIADSVKKWLSKAEIGTHYIEPGSPWQNAYAESFNSIFRITCLDRWEFESVQEARAVTTNWQHEYNTIRPHGSLGGRAPAQFIEGWADDRRETSTKKQVGNA